MRANFFFRLTNVLVLISMLIQMPAVAGAPAALPANTPASKQAMPITEASTLRQPDLPTSLLVEIARQQVAEQLARPEPTPVPLGEVLPPGTIGSRQFWPYHVYLPVVRNADGPAPKLMSPAATAAWEQTITPLGSGFEPTAVPYNGWIRITDEHPLPSCSMDPPNAIYNQTSWGGSPFAWWTPNLPATAWYRVYAYMPQYEHWRDITTQAPYFVNHADGTGAFQFVGNVAE